MLPSRQTPFLDSGLWTGTCLQVNARLTSAQSTKTCSLCLWRSRKTLSASSQAIFFRLFSSGQGQNACRRKEKTHFSLHKVKICTPFLAKNSARKGGPISHNTRHKGVKYVFNLSPYKPAIKTETMKRTPKVSRFNGCTSEGLWGREESKSVI